MQFQPETIHQTAGEYFDNWFARLFIWLFSRKMARAVGKDTPLRGYAGFVDLSKQIMAGRNPQEQQQVVRRVLRSLVPAPVLFIIRSLFSPTQLVCELNAWFATRLFEWLVGSCEVLEAQVTDAQGTVKSQKSNVHIKKCRYLEHSGCVGMCINMCKLPTQEFFTQEFGIPLTMTPNFEDLSCEMVFGQLPPALETEAAYHQPCLTTLCPTAMVETPSCPKVRR
jgi:hypothetical protein